MKKRSAYIPRWLRITLTLIVMLCGIIVLTGLCLVWYIDTHKKEILKSISEQISGSTGGTLVIKDIHPTLLRGFPDVSVSLDSVSLRDSLWAQHHHDLLNIEKLFVGLDLRAILSRSINIRELTAENGNVYIFTDSTGYSNTSTFTVKKDTGQSKSHTFLRKIVLKNISLVIEEQAKNKRFRFEIEKWAGKTDFTDNGWALHSDLKMHVTEMAFNLDKGSFLHDKWIKTDLELQYNKSLKQLTIPKQKFRINKQDINIGGQFSFLQKPASFSLEIEAKDIAYAEARSLLTPSISNKLSRYDLAKPLDVYATLAGSLKYRDTPMVVVRTDVKDNTLTTSLGEMEHCSFKGVFTDEVVKGMGFGNNNSSFTAYAMKAEFQSIPFNVDTLRVTSLGRPHLFILLRSGFPVTTLNGISGAETFKFDKGTAAVNLRYDGSMVGGDTLQPYLKGYISISNAAVTYTPRNLSFVNCSGQIRFDGYDLYANNMHLQTKENSLDMNGSAKNFLSFLWRSPDKILLQWGIRSSHIKLDEFSGFLQQRKMQTVTAATRKRKPGSPLAAQVAKVMDLSNVRLQVNVNKLTYRRFSAYNIDAGLALLNTSIQLDHVDLGHAGGNLHIAGNIRPQPNGSSAFALNASLSKVKVDQLFEAFDNFGQDAIEKQNLRGQLSAQLNVTGAVGANNRITPRSIKGKVHFTLDDGALLHYAPLEKISHYVFKKRNLSNVTFSKIENTLDIDGKHIVINPMLIESSALNLHIGGVYDPPNGTDINMEVPIRNPQKDELNDDDEGPKNWKKGIVFYLKAKDGPDGVKIAWDPMRRFKKKKGKGDEE